MNTYTTQDSAKSTLRCLDELYQIMGAGDGLDGITAHPTLKMARKATTRAITSEAITPQRLSMVSAAANNVLSTGLADADQYEEIVDILDELHSIFQ